VTTPVPDARAADTQTADALQARFLALLPRLERHARILFRHLRCPGRRADAVAEAIALAWKWYLRLCARGKDVARFVSVLAAFAARPVRIGRRLCGTEPSKDVLSPRAQTRRGFVVQALPAHDSGTAENPALDALIDNTQTPPDEQAAFRIDFPAWLGTLGDRNRAIALEMMVGESTMALAPRHGLSPARISQLRRELCSSWRRFCGEGA
jgi:hypothetical protein